jgi:hypothetical protein
MATKNKVSLEAELPFTQTPLVATGVQQEATSVLNTRVGTPITFTPSGKNDLIVIKNAGSVVTLTATCQAPCGMPLACNVVGGTDDAGMHDFVMSCTSTQGELTFVIPYLEHYVNPTTGKVSLVPDANMTDHGKLAILTTP